MRLTRVATHGFTLAVLGAALLPAAARAQAAPADPWGTLPEEAVMLKLDEPSTGALNARDARFTGRVDTPSEFNLVQIRISHTNSRCEVWASLVDLDGTELGRTYVRGSGENTVTGLAAAAGPIFVIVDNGPFAQCAGAEYRLVPTVKDFAPATFSPSDAGAPSAANDAGVKGNIACYGWSKRAEQLGIKLRRTAEALKHARGNARMRLRRKLVTLRRVYDKARKSARAAC
jgi:hypothetical protein